MAERKKIILFIVEGITDKTCLGYVLSKIINTNRVEFAITGGDITTKRGINSGNVSSEIGNIIREFSGKIFKAKDFCEIVHLVDTDGAYVEDNRLNLKTPETPVDPHDLRKLYYTDDNIFVNDLRDTQQRNLQKTSILNRLISLNKVWVTIPYSMYFFSCNYAIFRRNLLLH
ncbi:MAG: hypothetical protein APF81_02900 [Desulfosporosinus sp. BRH_c37]|nr:MAG: hypothetical protein APF81_02900 [Desulfosporosinus sp. BRH_c37]